MPNPADITTYGRSLDLELLDKKALHIWIDITYAYFITD
jgi:hypothetical protein